MFHKIHPVFLSILLLFLSITVSYTQVVLTASSDSSKFAIDYKNPVQYEVGGITNSGTAYLDQRFIRFSVGDKITIPGDEITNSVKSLWNTGLYEDIDITVTKIVGDLVFLDVYLVERSRLVAFGFMGANKSQESDLREKLKISQGNIVNDNMKRTCSNIILDYYIDKGFYYCEVKVEERKSEKISNGIDLIFHINKGKRIKINNISFKGNHNVSKFQLIRAMKETKEKSVFMPFYKMDTSIRFMFQHPDYYRSKDIFEHIGEYFADRIKMRIVKKSKYIEEKYETDKVSLIEKFNELGYRDACIVKDTIVINKDGMNIYIDVNEGDKYYFRNINFVGNTKHSSEILHQLLKINKGDVYNQAYLIKSLTMNENGNDISSLYMNDGYLFFSANPVEILIDQDSIDIEIRIIEGKQARYNKISISGNTKTNDNVIIRELTTLPGQMFNRADLIRSQQVLLSLGYFNQEKMNVIPKPNEADGTVDIEYMVEETSSDQVQLSAGYGQGGFVLSGQLTFNNISLQKFFKKDAWTPIPHGDGQKLALQASTNALWYQYYSISFTEPWLGGKRPNTLGASIYYQRQSNGYKKKDNPDLYSSIDIVGGAISLSQKLKLPDDYFQMSHTLSYQRYRVYNYAATYTFANGSANNISYTWAIGRYSVDAPIYPRSGSDIMFSVQLTPPFSLLNNKDYSSMEDEEKYKWMEFYKWKFNISWFSRIVENLVVHLRLKTGFMGYYNPTVGLAPFERFHLGGDGLSTYGYDGREVIGMRGYDEDDLTPTNGAGIYNKLTAEIRYPVSLNPNATIYLLAFVEAGKTWMNIREYNPFNLYKSAGVGIRIHLPMFGLLGLDWGYGLDKLPGSDKPAGGRFHISINSSID